MEKKIEKLNELLLDVDVQNEAKAIKDPEELRQILAQHGLELTADEMEEILVQLGGFLVENNLMTEDGELTEEGMDQVSGGGFGAAIAGLKIGTAISGGNVLVGAAVFIGVCAVTAYVTYNQKKRGK